MDETCIVCGAPADRVAKSRHANQTAFVCSAGHARAWQRSVRGPREKADPDRVAMGTEKKQGEDRRQLTFLGGEAVK